MATNKVKAGKSRESYGQRYKANKTQEVNRKRKLLKQLKLQPNNKQVEMALKDIRYRRKSPRTPKWSHSLIHTAKLFKQFCGRFSMEFVSNDPKISQAALHEQSPVAAEVERNPAPFNSVKDRDFFSLNTRNNRWRIN